MVSASIKFFAGLVLVGLLLFLPAGTIHYPYGWLLVAVLFVPMYGHRSCRARSCHRR